MVGKVALLFAGSSAGPKDQGPQFIFTWFSLWAPWLTLGMVAVSQKRAFHKTGSKCCWLTEAQVQSLIALLHVLK